MTQPGGQRRGIVRGNQAAVDAVGHQLTDRRDIRRDHRQGLALRFQENIGKSVTVPVTGNAGRQDEEIAFLGSFKDLVLAPGVKPGDSPVQSFPGGRFDKGGEQRSVAGMGEVPVEIVGSRASATRSVPYPFFSTARPTVTRRTGSSGWLPSRIAGERTGDGQRA